MDAARAAARHFRLAEAKYQIGCSRDSETSRNRAFAEADFEARLALAAATVALCTPVDTEVTDAEVVD